MGLDAGRQLAGTERLDDVVVGSDLETNDAIEFGVFRGEEDDGYVATATRGPRGGFLADRPADVQSVHPRHQDVEDHEIGSLAREGGQAGTPVAGFDDVEARPPEREADDIPDVGVVVDDEDLVHGVMLRCWRTASQSGVGTFAQCFGMTSDCGSNWRGYATSSVVSRADRRAFDRNGFVLLRSVIDPDTLAMLREECAVFVGRTDAWLDARGLDVLGITHRGRRYFIPNRYRDSDRMPEFVFGELMRDIATSLLGDTVYLFNEQWVVKGAEEGMKFAWHQDSGYVNFRDPGNRHAPYLTCWCALDDMGRENGTISVMPHDRVGSRTTVFPHRREEGTNDLVGYDGDDPGVLVEMPAGNVAVFSSTSLHRSDANTTPNLRRAYLTQYTSEPLLSASGEPWGQAVPFVANGQLVYERTADPG